MNNILSLSVIINLITTAQTGCARNLNNENYHFSTITYVP